MCLEKLRTLRREHILLVIVMVKTLLEPFTKKKSKSKVMIFHLIVGLIKKYCYTKWIIFPNNIPVVKKKKILNYIWLMMQQNFIWKTPQVSIHKHLLKTLLWLQSLTKYLGLTLVFLWIIALWEKFNFCFSRVFC